MKSSSAWSSLHDVALGLRFVYIPLSGAFFYACIWRPFPNGVTCIQLMTGKRHDEVVEGMRIFSFLTQNHNMSFFLSSTAFTAPVCRRRGLAKRRWSPTTASIRQTMIPGNGSIGHESTSTATIIIKRSTLTHSFPSVLQFEFTRDHLVINILCNRPEGIMNVDSWLGWCFNELDVVEVSECFSLIGRDFPIIHQIRLTGNHLIHCLTWLNVPPDLKQPVNQMFEWGSLCDVIHKKGSNGITIIGPCDGSKLLLSGSVP